MSKFEHCRNPWNGKCKSTDIKLYIMHKGVQLPICRRCWTELAEKSIEWGESPSGKTPQRKEGSCWN